MPLGGVFCLVGQSCIYRVRGLSPGPGLSLEEARPKSRRGGWVYERAGSVSRGGPFSGGGAWV